VKDVAILKALYVHPDAGRKGVGRKLLKACEDAAKERGFKRMEMGATFAGKEFYLREGYEVLRDEEGKEMQERRGLGEGEKLELVRMGRDLV
jgi:GNAT superfamily N-acetyltransferase